jgi:hypothetical protein
VNPTPGHSLLLPRNPNGIILPPGLHQFAGVPGFDAAAVHSHGVATACSSHDTSNGGRGDNTNEASSHTAMAVHNYLVQAQVRIVQ